MFLSDDKNLLPQRVESFLTTSITRRIPSSISLSNIIIITPRLQRHSEDENFLLERKYKHSLMKDTLSNKHHPTFYEESPAFQGPLVIDSFTTHQRIRHYSEKQVQQLHQFEESEDERKDDETEQERQRSLHINKRRNQNSKHLYYITKPPKILHTTDSSPTIMTIPSTQSILQTIVHALIYYNIPIDIKEVVESMEFVLRSKNRLVHAMKQDLLSQLQEQQNTTIRTEIHIHDLCAGHGLTGLLVATCLYYPIVSMMKKSNNTSSSITQNTIPTIYVTLVDFRESKVFPSLLSMIQQVCPWMVHVDIYFPTMSLQHYFTSKQQQQQRQEDVLVDKKTNPDHTYPISTHLVVAIHACGSLTDDILSWAVSFRSISAIAVMPCCYTGTDVGMPYGLQRALGVSWNADIRRTLLLQQYGYHVDLGCIPKEITPMNRIIFGEKRKEKKK